MIQLGIIHFIDFSISMCSISVCASHWPVSYYLNIQNVQPITNLVANDHDIHTYTHHICTSGTGQSVREDFYLSLIIVYPSKDVHFILQMASIPHDRDIRMPVTMTTAE